MILAPTGDMPLSPKYTLFIEAYCMGRNATQAAIAAGYSPKTAHVQGSRMLTNVKVSSNIEDRLQDHRERCNVTMETLTAELEETRLLAMKAGKPTAAVKAITAKAKLHGFI